MQCTRMRVQYRDAARRSRTKAFDSQGSFDEQDARDRAEFWISEKRRVNAGYFATQPPVITRCTGQIKAEVGLEWSYYDDVNVEVLYRCGTCHVGFIVPRAPNGEPYLPTTEEELSAVINFVLDDITEPEEFIRSS